VGVPCRANRLQPPVGSTERSVLPNWLLVLALSLRVLPTIQRLVVPSWLLVLVLSLRVLPTIQRLVVPSLQQLAAR
jgi:hypothetical protein